MNRILTALAALALSATAVLAQDYSAGSLDIHRPVSRATLPGQPVGGGFLTVTNKGTEADRLVSIAAPSVSDDVQLHEMAVADGVMTMRPLKDGIEIPAGATVELKPGGLHVMFMAIKQPFKEGEAIPATLTFEKAGAVDVEFKVEAMKPAAAGHGEAGHE
ncbi:copper chaperone PCu(A)C [Shinella pollutisoli]|uniref:Copper chaperone PCu(A)C n=1 Tax=Shinella pollutisoli TaxID=2250594 RepID=A0ABV7DHM7_9HYPH|nr:copper chaperone PCu(A)C [Shinella pollutisoli]